MTDGRTPGSRMILVAGATGYVGGRLVPRLLERGHRVRCLVRDAVRFRERGWEQAEPVIGDALYYSTLAPALEGVEAAYYLVHSLSAGEPFADHDREAATNFGRAARAAGVQRIIYLGGMGAEDDRLSPHLRSRHVTGECLREWLVPVTEFRAGVILGSGSTSFELIRYLVERLPVLFCPPVVRTLAQPIGIRDVLRYLVASLDVPESAGRVLEIGGADVLSYADMLLGYARVRGLHRRIVIVPFLTPRMVAYWAGLVTPMPAAVVRPLFESAANQVICRSDEAVRMFGFQPLGYEENIRLALDRIMSRTVETVWSDAVSSAPHQVIPVQLKDTQGMIVEQRQHVAQASAATAFSVISGIGGHTGWPYADFLWDLRGLLDRLWGGVGVRRPRRNPERLRVGDALDYWRVEAITDGSLLRLRSEMRLPGRAWLQFKVETAGESGTLITQTAFYEPRGLFGQLYWWVLYPVHRVLFRGVIRSIARKAEQIDAARPERSAG